MPTFDIEQEKSSRYDAVIGVDEAGRGPLAGPVVAAAAWYRQRDFAPSSESGEYFRFIRDSKTLSEQQRERVFARLSDFFEIGIGVADAATIDCINILQATFLAMRGAVYDLQRTMNNKQQGVENRKQIARNAEQGHFEYTQAIVLVDGNKNIPDLVGFDQEAVVKGDAKSWSIAAASIAAKVTRDRMMWELDERYPEYGFAQHKGYGTREHLEVLRRFGPIPEHRRSFSPVSACV